MDSLLNFTRGGSRLWKGCILQAAKLGTEPFNTGHWAVGSGLCTTDFQSCFDQYFLTMRPFLPLLIVMHILCHYILGIYNLLFYFIRIAIKKIPRVWDFDLSPRHWTLDSPAGSTTGRVSWYSFASMSLRTGLESESLFHFQVTAFFCLQFKTC